MKRQGRQKTIISRDYSGPDRRRTPAIVRLLFGKLRRRQHWSSPGWVLAFGLFILCQAAAAQVAAKEQPGAEITPAHMQVGSLLYRMKTGYVIATRMNTEVDVQVSGLVARVSVRQSFRNDGQQWVEGIYVFPLPDEAAVDRLEMRIGERVIEGDIQEKEKARRTYEAARQAGQKTSLVEQQRANMFTTSVANIGPGETITIAIEYLETLRYDEGNFSLRFPMTMTPRYIPGQPLPGRRGNGWSPDTTQVPDASAITPPVVSRSRDHKVTFQATIDAGFPLEYIASRYHPIDVSDASGTYAVSLKHADTPMDHDLELTWRPVPDAAPRAAVFTETVDGEPHALIMLLPPNDVSAPAQHVDRELIFVIDTSGSMHGTSLAQATRALNVALDGLGPTDRFNVVQFNSTTSALFPGSVEAGVNNVGIAKRFVNGLVADGGTEMWPAISMALEYPYTESHLRQVIFITDGSVGNEQELFGLIERKLGRTRMFTVGIGSAPNSWFMRKAAEAGHGSFTMISALHEVNEKMDRLFRKIEQPQVTDIRVEWPAGTAPEAYPATIPDLYIGEPILVRSRLGAAPRAGDLLTVSGNSPSGAWGAELAMGDADGSAGIAALWARSRIEDLLDRERHGEDVRQAVVETAIKHHLVSKYTSLVAVDKTPAGPQGEGLDQEQVPSLLPYGQSTNKIFGFAQTATGAPVWRQNGMMLIVLSSILLTLLLAGRRREPAAR